MLLERAREPPGKVPSFGAGLPSATLPAPGEVASVSIVPASQRRRISALPLSFFLCGNSFSKLFVSCLLPLSSRLLVSGPMLCFVHSCKPAAMGSMNNR